MVNEKNMNNQSEHDNKKNENLLFNLDNINDENFRDEALSIYTAINEGKIDLTPQEKQQLLKELELILNHFNSSQSKDNLVDYPHFNDNQSINNSLKVENGTNYENKSNDFAVNDLPNEYSDDSISSKNPNASIIDEDKSSRDNDEKNVSDEVIVDGDDSSLDDIGTVSGDLSVDDALNELIDDGYLEPENNLLIEDSVDHSPVENVKYSSVGNISDDVSDDLSVDDALNDLIDDYSNEVAIKVNNVTMQFKVSKDKIDTLKEYFIRSVKRNKSDSKTITALDHVSFEIPKGDRVGIIGFNGAGKSTLMKVLAGVYDATEGTIETKGKIAPLLELGAGFDSNYTGKDNIFLNGAFLGYGEDFLKEKYDEIVEFSELGDAINYHVKTYSSGMRAKLAFSIATIVEPEILILDEVLSVGDIKFKKKSADKIRSLITSGITVLLVSHSVGQIRDLCNKAIWIDEGKLKMMGEVNEVCDAYVKAASKATKDQLENISLN